jgi:hypothetical protein
VECYKDVLVIAETSQSEVNAFQLKSYAAGVGNIHVGWRGEGEKTQEVLELTEFRPLSADELAAANAEALKLEQSGYELSKDVYAHTPPLVGADGSVVAAPAAGAAETSGSAAPAAAGAEIVVYTADLAEETLYELELWEDPDAAEGELLGVTNAGDELDAPPENDPHVLFPVVVEADTPYRCWVHMKVGAPKGVSTANLVWVQFGNAVDADGQERFRPESDSFLTAQGPTTEGWSWVPCTVPDGDAAASLIRFAENGETSVRIQAGMEGVGFDQFILSAATYLAEAPTAAIVTK